MSGWPLSKLCDVASVSAGTSAPQGDRYFEDGEFNFVRTQDVGRYGFTTSLVETKDKINKRAISEKRLKLARKGASVFPKSGASILTNSRAVLGVDSYVVSHLAIVEAKQELLDDYYLYYFLRTVDFGEIAQSEEGYPSLRLSEISNIEIPVPPLDEQHRIVARIEELTRRAEEARKTADEREAELDLLLKALYSQMIEGAKWKPLCDVVSLIRRPVGIKPEFEYEGMGVRSFGKGTFAKPLVKGEQLIGKQTFWIRQGDLVFSGIFAWEKAIAVATPEDDGRVASHRFLTYLPHEQKATAEFLCYHFLSNQGIIDIRSASPSGAGGRNRPLSRIKLEKILVPIPNYEKQLRFSDIAMHRLEIQKETTKVIAQLQVYLAAVIAKAFRGEM